MADLKELVRNIIADGVVDTEEVEMLKKELYADGVIDREEADALFEINDAVSGNGNCPEWGEFFAQAIGDHVLKDEETPGVVDEAEGDYIVSKIEGDNQVDKVEVKLLTYLDDNAESIESDNLLNLIAANV